MRFCEHFNDDDDGICGASILDYMWSASKFCQEHRKKKAIPRKATFIGGNLNITRAAKQQYRAKIIAEVLKTPKILGYRNTLFLLLDCFKLLVSRGEQDFIFDEYHISAEDKEELFKLDLISDDD